jgi:two-component system response regulator
MVSCRTEPANDRTKQAGRFPDPRRLNREVSPGLARMIARMLARIPDHRHQDCAQLIEEITALGLAGKQLSFDLRTTCRALYLDPGSSTAERQVEVLLIHDDREATRLAYLALCQCTVQVNLTVMANGQETLASLRGQASRLLWPMPHLVLLALDLDRPAALSLLDELRCHERLRTVPLVVLSKLAGAARVVRQRGLTVHLVVGSPDDAEDLAQLVESVHDLNVTVVQVRGRQGTGSAER